MKKIIPRSIHQIPRKWSNDELKKFAHHFKGDIVNVSAWQDSDKQGKKYSDYFLNAESYTITNFKEDMRGFQGYKGEIFLDLEKTLPSELKGKFDVVFNHTTLEHVYDFQTATDNLCKMSKDIVILVVPFLQVMHGNYGDYWRFSPEGVVRMFERRNMKVAYLSFNKQKRTSVYIFCIATKNPDKWKNIFSFNYSFEDKNESFMPDTLAGCNALRMPLFFEFWESLLGIPGRIIQKIKNISSKR